MNHTIKKIGWLRRLFMSWNTLTNYFANSKPINIEEVDNLQAQLTEMTKQKTVEREENIKHKASLASKIEQLQQIEDATKANKTLQEQITKSQNEKIADLNQQLTRAQVNETSLNKNINQFKTNKINWDITNAKLKTKLDSVEKNKNELSNLINNKLSPINKLNKIFLGDISIQDGKGFLGELQLEEILKKTDIGTEFYKKNLQVGKNTVEFAIKSGQDKWIPVDSKVLEIKTLDKDNKMIVNDNYKARVLAQVKNVEKYINKKQTTEYGILVLQNNNIYIELLNRYPQLFKDAIIKHHVYILSPPLFVQFSWTMSHLLKIYREVHQEQQLYDDISKLAKKITNFARNIETAYTKFHLAMTNNYPAIQKDQNKISDNYFDKLKKAKPIEFKN